MVEVSLNDLIIWFFINISSVNGMRIATEKQIKQFVVNVREKAASQGMRLVSSGYDYRLLGGLFNIIDIDGNGFKMWTLKSLVTKEILYNSLNDKNMSNLFNDLELVAFLDNKKKCPIK